MKLTYPRPILIIFGERYISLTHCHVFYQWPFVWQVHVPCDHAIFILQWENRKQEAICFQISKAENNVCPMMWIVKTSSCVTSVHLCAVMWRLKLQNLFTLFTQPNLYCSKNMSGPEWHTFPSDCWHMKSSLSDIIWVQVCRGKPTHGSWENLLDQGPQCQPGHGSISWMESECVN